MSIDEYKKALKVIRADLEAARRREVELNDELLETRMLIAELATTERGMARLCKEDSIEQKPKPDESLARMLGLSDAIRGLLKSMPSKSLTALEIRDRLAAVGFDSKRFKNLTASIHTSLKRLAGTGEIKPTTKNGKAAYQWNPEYKKAV